MNTRYLAGSDAKQFSLLGKILLFFINKKVNISETLQKFSEKVKVVRSCC